MTKTHFITIVSIFVVAAAIILNVLFNVFTKTSNRYEQLTNRKSLDSVNISQDICKDATKPTVQDMQEYFRPPVFQTWFTNGTFYLKDLEIGKIKYNRLIDDKLIPEIKTSVVSVANKGTIIAFDPKKHDETYLEFTYRNLRYQICCSKNGHGHNCIKIYGRQLTGAIPRIQFSRIGSRFWFREMLNRNVYVSKWTIDTDGNEWLKVYRDDENKILVEFNHI